MTRQLDTATLDGAAKHFAGHWLLPDRKSRNGKRFVQGPALVIQDLYNLTFKDEFEYVLEGVKARMGSRPLAEFEAGAKARFKPRSDKVFAQMLREHLAIDPDGKHIDGVVGKTEVGRYRVVAREPKLVTLPSGRKILLPKKRVWPIYAGETAERLAGRIRAEIGVGPGADPLPEGTEPLPVGANVTNISAEMCIAALDQAGLRFDEGTTAAEIRGRTGAQPADPDAAETGTLLFTNPMSDPSMPAGVDDGDGSCSVTANAITDDTPANATGTVGYCRVAATGTGLDDHLDGNAGTVDEAFLFNTVAITAGSMVSITSFVLGMSQGSTAT